MHLLIAFYFFMLSEMSNDLSVKLYFGNGQIRYCEHGVDLSNLILLTMCLKEQPQELLVNYPVFLVHFR
jgi:hypothetical protein